MGLGDKGNSLGSAGGSNFSGDGKGGQVNMDHVGGSTGNVLRNVQGRWTIMSKDRAAQFDGKGGPAMASPLSRPKLPALMPAVQAPAIAAPPAPASIAPSVALDPQIAGRLQAALAAKPMSMPKVSGPLSRPSLAPAVDAIAARQPAVSLAGGRVALSAKPTPTSSISQSPLSAKPAPSVQSPLSRQSTSYFGDINAKTIPDRVDNAEIKALSDHLNRVSADAPRTDRMTREAPEVIARIGADGKLSMVKSQARLPGMVDPPDKDLSRAIMGEQSPKYSSPTNYNDVMNILSDPTVGKTFGGIAAAASRPPKTIVDRVPVYRDPVESASLVRQARERQIANNNIHRQSKPTISPTSDVTSGPETPAGTEDWQSGSMLSDLGKSIASTVNTGMDAFKDASEKIDEYGGADTVTSLSKLSQMFGNIDLSPGEFGPGGGGSGNKVVKTNSGESGNTTSGDDGTAKGKKVVPPTGELGNIVMWGEGGLDPLKGWGANGPIMASSPEIQKSMQAIAAYYLANRPAATPATTKKTNKKERYKNNH